MGFDLHHGGFDSRHGDDLFQRRQGDVRQTDGLAATFVHQLLKGSPGVDQGYA
ncbi:hypothetical protein D3C78_1926200 [compost metagenome]